jgi:hypothetical protein
MVAAGAIKAFQKIKYAELIQYLQNWPFPPVLARTNIHQEDSKRP